MEDLQGGWDLNLIARVFGKTAVLQIYPSLTRQGS